VWGFGRLRLRINLQGNSYRIIIYHCVGVFLASQLTCMMARAVVNTGMAHERPMCFVKAAAGGFWCSLLIALFHGARFLGQTHLGHLGGSGRTADIDADPVVFVLGNRS